MASDNLDRARATTARQPILEFSRAILAQMTADGRVSEIHQRPLRERPTDSNGSKADLPGIYRQKCSEARYEGAGSAQLC
jgi:hypothetical protein